MFETAINAVVQYYNSTTELNGGFTYITTDDVYIVWFCKTLQNFKVILATPFIGKELYEFTYNGNKQEAYLDVYTKIDNQIIKFHGDDNEQRI